MAVGVNLSFRSNQGDTTRDFYAVFPFIFYGWSVDEIYALEYTFKASDWQILMYNSTYFDDY